QIPQPEKLIQTVVGVSLQKWLIKINARIEALLDRDHTIGHAYFLEADNEGELKQVFRNKIIPLLQEYFYGDYGKIGLVLGQGFVREQKSAGNLFAQFPYPGSEQFILSKYELLPIDEHFDIRNALQILMNEP
ncbi:UNVERIFIED_CONTAM: AAA family ATPase, partial [Salmonella enterica subsp. enterica serovar Weltevreden]